jgi:hypothetical protein
VGLSLPSPSVICSALMSIYLRPQPLELTAADEMLAIENIDVLQRNGFEVDVDEVTASGLAHRLKLVRLLPIRWRKIEIEMLNTRPVFSFESAKFSIEPHDLFVVVDP